MDLILNSLHNPTFQEITDYIEMPYRSLWVDFNNHIQSQYKSTPKLSYSTCSGKPGWNVKYQKSGKSLCTLYPEKEGFVALIVVSLELGQIINSMEGFDKDITTLIQNAKPFNGTQWLMINVNKVAILKNVKDMLHLKQEFSRKVK
jgi:hypothetical protein